MKRKSLNVKKINPKEILSYLSDVKIEKIYRIFRENIRDIKKKIVIQLQFQEDRIA